LCLLWVLGCGVRFVLTFFFFHPSFFFFPLLCFLSPLRFVHATRSPCSFLLREGYVSFSPSDLGFFPLHPFWVYPFIAIRTIFNYPFFPCPYSSSPSAPPVSLLGSTVFSPFEKNGWFWTSGFSCDSRSVFEGPLAN